MTVCPVKPAVYLTDPAEMRRARLNQPRVSSAQFRTQLLAMRREQERCSADAKPGTSLRGRAKAAA